MEYSTILIKSCSKEELKKLTREKEKQGYRIYGKILKYSDTSFGQFMTYKKKVKPVIIG